MNKSSTNFFDALPALVGVESNTYSPIGDVLSGNEMINQ